MMTRRRVNTMAAMTLAIAAGCMTMGLQVQAEFQAEPIYPFDSVVLVDSATGFGSGVVVGPQMVLTARHVLDLEPDSVVLSDGRRLPILGTISGPTDVAILIVMGSLPAPVRFDMRPVTRGEHVYAIGNPFSRMLQGSLCHGRVTNTSILTELVPGRMDLLDFTDIQGGGGMSGGPVLRNGRIVGIAVATLGKFLVVLPVDQFTEFLHDNGLQ